MKKWTGLALFFFTLLTACVMPQLPQVVTTPTVTTTAPPTQPALSQTPAATLEPPALTATARAETRTERLEATDTAFFSFCGKKFIPEWGNHSGIHINEFAKDWVTLECRSGNGAERYKKFVYKRGLKIWDVSLSDKTLLKLKENYDISLNMELLSKNGRDVYLSPSYHLKDGTQETWDPEMPLRYTTGFYQLNLETGDFKALFNPHDNPGIDFSYALSSDETWLVFAKDDEKNIFYVRDLRKNLDKKVELKSNVENIGAFVWTPDNKKVIFVAVLGGWRDNESGTFIYSYTPETNQLAVVVHNDLQQRMPFPNNTGYWQQKNFLNLISAQNGTDEWTLDIRNGYIGAISTPTPQP